MSKRKSRCSCFKSKRRGSVKMSEVKMMKVKEGVKERVEQLKSKLRASSESDVIQKLLEYYDKNERHVELTDEVSGELKELKNYLRVSDEVATIKVLLHHFDMSSSVPKTVIEMVRDNQRYSRW